MTCVFFYYYFFLLTVPVPNKFDPNHEASVFAKMWSAMAIFFLSNSSCELWLPEDQECSPSNCRPLSKRSQDVLTFWPISIIFKRTRMPFMQLTEWGEGREEVQVYCWQVASTVVGNQRKWAEGALANLPPEHFLNVPLGSEEPSWNINTCHRKVCNSKLRETNLTGARSKWQLFYSAERRNGHPKGKEKRCSGTPLFSPQHREKIPREVVLTSYSISHGCLGDQSKVEFRGATTSHFWLLSRSLATSNIAIVMV